MKKSLMMKVLFAKDLVFNNPDLTGATRLQCQLFREPETEGGGFIALFPASTDKQESRGREASSRPTMGTPQVPKGLNTHHDTEKRCSTVKSVREE